MRNPRRTRFLVAFGAMVVGVGILVGLSFQGSMVYYCTVAEYVDGPCPGADPVRVNGRVVPGSIQREAGRLGVRFQMTDGVRVLPVAYAREVPDTFVDRAEVVVEGERDPQGVFQAQVLLAKCPSKYEASDPGEHPDLE
ncbi:MAG: cytochrome c maturation protein CcmE [Acidobacteria bacterium]|nr:cytochrome c maturation protein CcmE [Acidobacteriota bacterium]